MKKFVLFILVAICYCSVTYGQDLTFDDLSKLRSYTFPKFESYVHEKGYSLNHLENNEDCSVFRNGGNVLSYCRSNNDGFSNHNHVSVKFETADKDEYERMKKDVTNSMDYYKTKMHRKRNEHFLEHIYVNDAMSVHLYDISYRNDENPYYAIEVYSIYSGY